MMGGAAFRLLKAGPIGPKSAQQAEIRLTYLLKILRNRPILGPEPRENAPNTFCGCRLGASVGYG
jgi:hypothetical protein